MFDPARFTLWEFEAVTSRKTRIYKEITKSMFETQKMKIEVSSGEKKSGPQPLNNSLSFVSTPKGERLVRIPGLLMHVLTLVANSTLLNYIRKNYRTVLRAGIVAMVLTRQRA